jgi:hypothetical protein
LRQRAAPSLAVIGEEFERHPIALPTQHGRLGGPGQIRILGMFLFQAVRPFEHRAVAVAAPDLQMVRTGVILFIVGATRKRAPSGEKVGMASQPRPPSRAGIDQKEGAAFVKIGLVSF